jgi:F0F1-type ATP synthase membrane subunit b/b'
MLTSLPSAILFLDGPTWWTRLEPYLDYPGFEAWKFVNLAVFVGIIIFILTRKVNLGEAFRARRDNIKQELARAQQERDAAVAKLEEVEERLARLDTELAEISERSKREAAEERERIAGSTETEIAKLSEQAQREIESAGKTARHELRRYAAEQSVRLAEEMIRREIKPEDDARLIDSNIRELGGAAR